MSDQDRPPSQSDFDARLRKAMAQREKRSGGGDGDDGRMSRGQGLAFALRIGTELVAAVIVGVAIGWLLDYWLGTKPWLMIVFFLLGSAAGVLNVFRTVSGIGHGVGYASRRNGKDRGERPEDKTPPDAER